MSLITPDFGLLFWMTLIFLIVFFILLKFGFPAITGMVEERSVRINESIAKAREAEESLRDLVKKQEEMIAQAKVEQGRILKEASEVREKMISDAKQAASAEAEKILSSARTEIAAEKESAMREIRSVAAELSIAVAEKVMRKELENPSKEGEFLDKLLDEIR